MTGNLIVTSSPHIRSKKTTDRIMLDVIIALLPAVIASAVLFGLRALTLIAVSSATCAVAEYIWCAARKIPNTAGDLSAVVTGILLAFNAPASLPVWQLMVGGVVAIIIVKELFGGIGCNFVNPALAGRVIMALSFPTTMTAYSFANGTLEGMSGATPLASIQEISSAAGGSDARALIDEAADLWSLLIGRHGGVLGETCALALIAGGVYLVIRGIIKPIIPLCFIGTTFLFHWIYGSAAPLHAVLSGGLMLGAIFMATDYTTSPYTNWGKVIFGVGGGVITATIRIFASSTEGMSYAILIMNLLVPYINNLTRKTPYGGAAK